MVHVQSFLIGSGVAASGFLLIHQQMSFRNRLSPKWPLRGMYVCMCNYYVWCIRRKWLTQYNGLSFVEGKLNCTVGTVSMQSKYHTIYIMSQPTVLCCVVFMCYRMGRTWSSVARVANPSCSRWCWHHHPDVYLEQYISRHGSLEQGTQVDSRCHCSSQGIRNSGYRLFYL